MRTSKATWDTNEAGIGKRIGVLAYGIVAYLLGVGALAYLAGFVGDFLVPRSLGNGPRGSVGLALAVNLALIGLFALQHSAMPRRSFKAWWTTKVPVAMERSTYVLGTAVVMAILFAFWRPVGGEVWSVGSPVVRTVLWGTFAAGWAILFLASWMIDHFDLFGLGQVWAYFRGRAYEPPRFMTRGFYRVIRHPIQTGLLIAFWSAPDMSVTRLVFAVLMTIYVVAALRLEERDLASEHGDTYRSYRARVGMLIPRALRPRTGERVG